MKFPKSFENFDNPGYYNYDASEVDAWREALRKLCQDTIAYYEKIGFNEPCCYRAQGDGAAMFARKLLEMLE